MKTATVLLLLVGTARAQQVMGPEKLAAYKSVMPRTDEPKLQEVIDSPDTVYYTEAEMPRLHQASFFPSSSNSQTLAGLRGIFHANQQVAAFPDGRSSNSSREFPWDAAGGVSSAARNVRTVKTWTPPRDAQGRILPVVVWGNTPIRWTFPRGTVFTETQFIRHTTGEWFPYETRMRTVEVNDHEVDLFKPFPEQQDLIAALQARGLDDLAASVKQGKVMRSRVRSRHPRAAFDRVAARKVLPPFPAEVVRDLLTTTEFKSSIGTTWTADAEGATCNSDFHLVSNQYFASHIGNEREQCRSCHNTAHAHNRLFDRQREWYGDVRGNAGILSWNPWQDRSGRLRREFVQAGLVARYNPAVHTREYYTQNKFQIDERKPYHRRRFITR